MVTTIVTTCPGTAETARPDRLVKGRSIALPGPTPIWLKQFEAVTVESEDDEQPTKCVLTELNCSEVVSVKLPCKVTNALVGGVAEELAGVGVFVSPEKQTAKRIPHS